MEHWAIEPEVMKLYAHHYQTGEAIPDELIAKMQAASSFNSGFETVELVAAALLDMEYHMLSDYTGFETNAFEKAVAEKIGLIPEITFRYRSTYFNHVFSGGYATGYYGYKWAEVLAADAFSYFAEEGIFNKDVAAKFRKLLQSGGQRHPMDIYVEFRGHEPQVDALIKSMNLQ